MFENTVKQLKHFYRDIPPQLKNKYVITLIVFGAWMAFFDRNNLISQIELKRELGALNKQKAYYLEKTLEVKQDQEELLSTPESIEKFAREKYWMKKDDEDLFIIVQEEKK